MSGREIYAKHRTIFLYPIYSSLAFLCFEMEAKRPKVILEGCQLRKRLIGRKILLSHSKNFSTQAGSSFSSRVKKSVNFYGLESDFNVLLDFYWLVMLAEHFKARENCHKRRRKKFGERHNSKNKNKALFWDQNNDTKKVFVNNLAIAFVYFRATVKGKNWKLWPKMA